MDTGRLEAFTDGVMAIVITIMVLEIKVPHGATLAALSSEAPVFFAYALSYVNVGIFWNNHHHMLQATERVDGRVLWMNLLLLFWISLMPFTIRWMGETEFAATPTAAYGAVLVMSGFSYLLLEKAIVACNGADSRLAKALGSDSDTKAFLSMVIYAVAIPIAYYRSWIAIALYVINALTWFIPDRRIEKAG
jgi:uncharacterized membrane protein